MAAGPELEMPPAADAQMKPGKKTESRVLSKSEQKTESWVKKQSLVPLLSVSLFLLLFSL